ncbi:MAG: insulinase family protein, partial [Deltaproteobacteria bacterium]|nr:insulinase family protein [Deltaproteobacteria bacterium]
MKRAHAAPLSNGVGLLVAESPTHCAAVQLWFPTTAGQRPGLAHLVEHLLVDQAQRFGPLSVGGHTSHDAIVLEVAAGPDDALTALSQLAAAVTTAEISQQQVEATRRVLALERFSVESDPLWRAQEACAAALFRGHPYGESIGGSCDQIEGLSRAQVFDFLRRFVHAANALVVVVGDVDRRPVAERAERVLGELAIGPPAHMPVPAVTGPVVLGPD